MVSLSRARDERRALHISSGKDMQVPHNFIHPDVLATLLTSAIKPATRPRDGPPVLEQQLPPGSSASKAPGLHPLVYAQQLGLSGLGDSSPVLRAQAQRQAGFSLRPAGRRIRFRIT